MNIAEYIPEGHDHHVTRRQLVTRTGLKDRHVRELINFANCHGEVILSDDVGYFRFCGSDDMPYVREYFAKERARTVSMLAKLSTMHDTLKKEGYDIALDD